MNIARDSNVRLDILPRDQFSDLVDLWVIMIKKPMILCARSVSTSGEHKITRLYDFQTWQTHFGGNSRGAQRYVGFFS